MDIKTPAQIPILSVGGRVFTDLANLITLRGRLSSSASATSGFRKSGTAAGYTPSGAKAFRVRAMKFRPISGALQQIALGYCDNDLPLAGTTAPTNPKDSYGGTAAMIIGQLPAGGTATSVYNEMVIDCDFLLPNGKYLFVQGDGSTSAGTLEILGYEEA